MPGGQCYKCVRTRRRIANRKGTAVSRRRPPHSLQATVVVMTATGSANHLRYYGLFSARLTLETQNNDPDVNKLSAHHFVNATHDSVCSQDVSCLFVVPTLHSTVCGSICHLHNQTTFYQCEDVSAFFTPTTHMFMVRRRLTESRQTHLQTPAHDANSLNCADIQWLAYLHALLW